MPVGAPSPYAAHLFMDFMCEPENAADLVNYVKYLSPHSAAGPMVNELIRTYTPSEADLERGEFQDDLGAFARNYTTAWAKVKNA